MKLTLLISALLLFLIAPADQDKYHRDRQQMVTAQLEARGISHEPTLNAMRSVERHRLVPPAQVQYAYEDRPLPIGFGQTISQPYMVGYMTEVIKPTAGMKVLEIGTGSGYQAAVLAEIVDEVYTIEIVEELAKTAKSRLEEMGYPNIHAKEGDGYFGWEEHAPFDAIIVTAASEFIPPPLIKQLKEGGKMVIPVGAPFTTQQLMLVEKQKDGKRKTRNLLPVRFVPFTRN
ncbi:protein-L-isoaspartate(D-aspartate) O-methyltransferase [Salegentibacter sp. JZCK2]|uniref:protein-L-isoaspartate(D-aspartate) O-methyltransferase n=1 Tax=Salegentibacter tibetensis TaxID=2873600 RepID=UPI001CCAACF7|nr:protein-L-isoaspartate(D-aspartate) O-methyltransferase [Salegentibacter tibetensis]MBZ9730571.1 protein-L-isoaspartate(D-aspartate) O-methyltransferase [Salegentibacter tibetensis]